MLDLERLTVIHNIPHLQKWSNLFIISIICVISGLSSMAYSKLELNGKVAVVVGGTSGIGRAIAHGFAQAGADVIPTSRRPEQVEVAATEIEALGRRSIRVQS